MKTLMRVAGIAVLMSLTGCIYTKRTVDVYMKIGDKVKVLSGFYENCTGTVESYITRTRYDSKGFYQELVSFPAIRLKDFKCHGEHVDHNVVFTQDNLTEAK